MVLLAASNSQQVVNAPLINEMEKTPQEANKSQDQIAGKLASPVLAAESNGSICLIVSSDDATAASQQVQTYLADNGISWQPENPERRLAFNGGFGGGGYGGGGNGGRAFGSGGLINNGALSTQPSAGDDRSFYAMNRYRSQQAAVHEPTAESEPRYFSKSGYAKDGALKEATKDASNATSTTTAPSDMTAQVEAAKQQSPAAASQIASAPALENARLRDDIAGDDRGRADRVLLLRGHAAAGSGTSKRSFRPAWPVGADRRSANGGSNPDVFRRHN